MHSIDVYKWYSQVNIMKECRKIVHRWKVNSDWNSIKRVLTPYTRHGAKAVLDSDWSWELIYNMFSYDNLKINVVHPFKVKAIAEAKINTDKISADLLVHLIRANVILECYIPDKSSRHILKVLSQRMLLVRLQTIVNNKIRNLINRQKKSRIQSHKFRDLFPAKEIQFLKSVSLPLLKRKLLDGQLELVKEIRIHISLVKSILTQLKENDQIVARLNSVPGIGEFLTFLIRPEINQIDHFFTSGKLCAYTNLVPFTCFSGDKTYHSRIVKLGNKYLRWALIKAVTSAIRNYYDLLKAKKGSNCAKVATTRKLLKIIYQVWRENIFYRIKTSRTTLAFS